MLPGSAGREMQAGRGATADGTLRDGLVPGGLNTPRPGVDLFRAGPDTYAPSPVVPWLSSPIPGPRWGAARQPASPGVIVSQHSRGNRGGRGGSRRGGGAAVIVPFPATGSVYASGGLYLSPYYIWPARQGQVGGSPGPAEAEPSGFLRLLVTPTSASVIVDGTYEGLVDDFGGSGERPLRAGVRHVRVEAEGYEPVEFDVRVPANDTMILRRDLNPLSVTVPRGPLPVPSASPTAPPPAAPPVEGSAAKAPAAVGTIYVIPRCYLGNTPPTQALLPAACRVADVRAIPQ
jgi:hypothetical protein